MSAKDISLKVSDYVHQVIADYVGADVVDFVDTRPYHPFGKDHDYSKEPIIAVDKVFATEKILSDFEVLERSYISQAGAERLNNWLAIVDHYGFDAPYDHDFLREFFPFADKALLQIYRDEEAYQGEYVSSPALPRLFHGKRYPRMEFVDTFLTFLENHGYHI